MSYPCFLNCILTFGCKHQYICINIYVYAHVKLWKGAHLRSDPIQWLAQFKKLSNSPKGTTSRERDSNWDGLFGFHPHMPNYASTGSVGGVRFEKNKKSIHCQKKKKRKIYTTLSFKYLVFHTAQVSQVYMHMQ
jgi:hypothetical protein